MVVGVPGMAVRFIILVVIVVLEFVDRLTKILCKFCVVEEQNNRISLPDDACQQAAF